jgi:hypothetical protein
MSFFTCTFFQACRRFVLLAGMTMALASPATSQADSKELLPLPPLNFHALTGTWWASTLFDDAGEPIWFGGQDDERVTMRVDLVGQFSSTIECNALFGKFEKAGEDGSVSITADGSMMTLKGCWGDYPPSIAFHRIARFERDGMLLRLFDENDLPIAELYNVYALHAALSDILGR